MTGPAERRAEALRGARRRDSLTKRRRVLDSLAVLEQRGEPITFAAVAHHARVSTWLVYAEGLREHITAGQNRQHHRPQPSLDDGMAASSASLRTDLELARDQIRQLHGERDALRDALRRRLGNDLDALGRADLTTRVDELTERNRYLEVEQTRLTSENHELSARNTVLESELAAARTSLRRMIRSQNREQS